MKRLVFALPLLLSLTFAQAADRGWKLPPDTSHLKPGPGIEVVTAHCLICHSADYIAIQPPLNRATWTATVTKMKEKYGAPIQPEHIEAVVNYLSKTYGTDKLPVEKK